MYDARERILYVEHPRPVVLAAATDIRDYFQSSYAYMLAHCKHDRFYTVVGYDNLSVDVNAKDSYGDELRATFSRFNMGGVARYGGDPLLHTTVRLVGMKLQTPPHVYATRDEALRAVRAMRDRETGAR